MTDSSFLPAPLVEQALQSLREMSPEPTPAPHLEVAKRQAESAPKTHAMPAHKPHVKPHAARFNHDPAQIAPDAAHTEVKTVAASGLALALPGGADSASLGAALEALRTLSVSAQARLADPEDFPDLPVERDLSDLGPYVEHVMREAQAAAVAFRHKAERDTTVRAAKLLGSAAASAEKIRQEADAYGERSLAQADALLAERVHRIAELTGHLAQMAQLAGDELAEDKVMRAQMMQFISALTAMAEEKITDLFPKTRRSSPRPQAEGARAPRMAPS